MIEFLLNKEQVKIDEAAPSLSVLAWIRTNKGLVGSKEGCGSGDCGACTVLIGEQKGKNVSYRTVNACLTPLASLHGKHLLTVESVSEAGALHPVQQAMIDCHGSQCGYCTPGFIMSMLSLYLSYEQFPGDEVTIAALGGNLCRCTGYRPILQAMEQAYHYPRKPWAWSELYQRFLEQLTENQLPAVSCRGATFYLPQNLSQLLEIKQTHPTARFIAGGTDLSLDYSQGLKPAETLIATHGVKEMRVVEQSDRELTIGAACSYEAFTPLFLKQFPEASELFHRLGSQQVRNAGTLGGSLGNASPISDPAPLLLALDAQLTLAAHSGSRRVHLRDFFIGYRKTILQPNEVIVSVHIPCRAPEQKLVVYKVSKRIEDDISAVCLCLSYCQKAGQIEAVRLAFGGMAAVPARAMHTEELITQHGLNHDAIGLAAEALGRDFSPLSDVRASADYRLKIANNLLKRHLLESQNIITRVRHEAL